MNTGPENTVTVPEAAAKLGLKVKTVRNHYLSEIKVKCDHYVIGRTTYIDRDSFDKYLKDKYKKKRLV